MDSTCQNSDFNVKYLLGQLNTARKEINNLRQQIKTLRYIHEKDVNTIKHLLESYRKGASISEAKVISDDVKPSTSADDDTVKLKPIGVVSTWFPCKRGTPRQPGICAKVPGKLLLYNSIYTNPDHALEGLQDFSHMWVLFYFHKNDATHVRAKVAPPRLNGTKTGVFSTRSPHRPCPIGLSLVKITRIENHAIYFEGVDMVDQSPVLDIKPYIPQYDSPIGFEKLNNRSHESDVDNTFVCIEENTDLSRNQTCGTFDANINFGDETGGLLSDSYYRKNTNEMSQEADISGDEEIALRLQAEEFQRSSNFENYNSARHFSELTDINVHNNSTFQHSVDVTGIHRAFYAFSDTSSDARSNLSISTGHNALSVNMEQQSESLVDVSNRLQNTNIGGPTSVEPLYTSRTMVSNYIEAHASRSRLLDGADGPSTVCGTDLDLIQRRSLNARVDNSPIRMGIREAPDGEEGLESQTLAPSQALPNVEAARPASNTNADTNSTLSSESRNFENREEANSEVRVPEWISRPRTPLCVIFNDRALIQLNEILGTKINDQKVAIENILREDPRSVYLRQRWGSQFYTFLIHDLHITCRFDDNRGVITVFHVRHAGRICECGEPEWQCLGHSPPPF
ncbi:tRNA (adenine(37)-N6)-methyltransferase [Hylaeus anthracinus]|uniref:tRNA (adenine(37)-N6)-methyltransferase n=1 Tax=Hylaeus anthracinus TaxID=313031 RepID=UPI0023B90333|nr:tRNA (adenine(37)-N6)-methyltransferase [Hylaeus anthracinus]